MEFYPQDTYSKLEFDKILDLAKQNCLGKPAIDLFTQLRPATSARSIKLSLDETEEFFLLMQRGTSFPIQAYQDVSESLKKLEIEDFVLDLEEIFEIKKIIIMMKGLYDFFNEDRIELYPFLYQLLGNGQFNESLFKELDKIIDEQGKVRRNASPELRTIYKLLGDKERELNRTFNEVIRKYKKNGWLKDNVESVRNGRRILAVASEHKRKIKGIIHDESTTGRTAYVEPQEVISVNNDIFDLQTEERREIYRLLQTLCRFLRLETGNIEIYLKQIQYYDFTRAKAKLGITMKAQKPQVKEGPYLKFKEAYHPLLKLKNDSIGADTIPFDLRLDFKNRILLLSGPNAGGKSIAMKAVGLLQLMFQSGFLIPCDAKTELGVFNKIFVDIGDQQSIDNDLSTYSSRLKNAKAFLDQATGETLLLIDEFGSGTDPKFGGAIAEAVLNFLHKQKVFGVVTTHYSNLKHFAYKVKGIVNGAMAFDMEKIEPSYKLRIGKPGSSYAFEIAQKSGLDHKVLNYARKYSGKNQTAIEDLLTDLQEDKRKLEVELDTLTKKQKNLDRLVKNYEHLRKELEVKRKKMKLDAKSRNLQNLEAEKKELRKVIKQLRESKNLEEAKALLEKVKVEQTEKEQVLVDLKEDLFYSETEDREFKVGDFVRLRQGEQSGEILDLKKKKAMVMMGDFRMEVPTRDLVFAKEPIKVNRKKSVNTDIIAKSAKFVDKMDIRGLPKNEAEVLVQDYLDQAMMVNSAIIKIVHGKGAGVLQEVVKAKLKEYDAVKKSYHPADEQGGEGVTIIEF